MKAWILGGTAALVLAAAAAVAQTRIGEAPPYLKYMSPHCASLNDAIRTAAIRGLRYDTQNEMRRNYRLECTEDENEARAQFYRDQRDQRQQKLAERKTQEKAQTQARLESQECAEGRRILFNKKKRTDLTEGEKADLQRFEESFRRRCG